jgi:phosphomevalonate kinase
VSLVRSSATPALRARAPGKIVVSGAYSVLEGAPAIVAAVDRYATADAGSEASFVTEEVRAAITAGVIPRACAFDASPLRSADGSRKLGLGSSAAILVATLAAMKGPPPDPAARAWLFEAALSAHRAAQQGGSGVDVAASFHGGTLVCELAKDRLVTRPHALPEGARVTILASRVSASTPELRGRVRAFRESDPSRYRALLGRAGAGARDAVAATTTEGLRAALAAQRDALAELGQRASAPILTPEVAELARVAEPLGFFVGPAGAGGGDVAIAVGAGALPPALEAAAAAAGLDLVDAHLGANGVEWIEVS